ncbi:MAG: hypothetical protein COB15_01390 [Flavobacteriales bacterium]|nr:MAG: hypothetical protein COB15_01390 [Flavobacteriales bacterium]
MKILNSSPISAFGGINFVYEDFDFLEIDKIFKNNLPKLSNQSKYTWKDILYSFMSIYLCGGTCIEDLESNLKPHLSDNPFCKIPSPDTILRRLKGLKEKDQTCRTKRGNVDHQYCLNGLLSKINLLILKKLDTFDAPVLTLDYDNTIVYNEKSDSKLTYKKEKGYQPGVCTINTNQIIYLENRNGNSDAKSFQDITLARMFNLLEENKVRKIDNFRADSASYQYAVIRLLEQKVKHFYIAAKNSYVEKYFSTIETWVETSDRKGNPIWIADIYYTPFLKQSKEHGESAKSYRLVVKRKKKRSNQIDLITQDTYEYTAVITNDNEAAVETVVEFYNKRGAMEKQFDVVKNDFGWNNMPFSDLASNTVFLFMTAICKNIYHKLIQRFSEKFEGLEPSFRIKRFIFKFIILPAKWIKKSRQNILRIYGNIAYKT